MNIMDRFANADEYEKTIYKNTMTHKEACLDYLERYGSITPLEALTAFHCFRLAAVIFKLREEGHAITTKINEGRDKYAIYTLVREGDELNG